jgi:hypothetical protein
MDQQRVVRRVAKGLGWFSLAFGAAELFAPSQLNRALGTPRRNGLVRGFGLREIGAGVGLLAMQRRAPWLWARVAGGALDLGTLAAAMRRSSRKKIVGAAIASVAAVTAVDAWAGWKASRA